MRTKLFSNYKFNRKSYLCILIIIICLITSLTIAYSILNTTLNISGSTNIVASNWNVYISSYIKVDEGSVTLDQPTLSSDKTHLDFSARLEEPGDYYRFVLRIRNKGDIDAMIESIIKTPELTEEQAKYLVYNIEYEDGTPITEKHFLQKTDGTAKVSVTVAYRKDVSLANLPTSDVNLNLGLSFVYTQADDSSVVSPSAAFNKLVGYAYVYDTFGNRNRITEDDIIITDVETYETIDCTITGSDYYCSFEEVYNNRKYKVSLKNHTGYVLRDVTMMDENDVYNSVIDENGYISIPSSYYEDTIYAKFYFDSMITTNKDYRSTIYVRQSSDASLVKIEGTSITLTNLLSGDTLTIDGVYDSDGLFTYSFSNVISDIPYEVTLNFGDVLYTMDSIFAKNGNSEYINVNYNNTSNKFIIPSNIKDSSKHINIRVYITLN